MFTVRNPKKAHARTVVAGEALTVGMIVKMVQGDAIGDPPKVMKVTTKADLQDAAILKGIVSFIPDNDLAVGFILDPTNEALTLNGGADNTHLIPSGAACVMWYGLPVIGLHQNLVEATLDVNAVREGVAVAFDTDTSRLTLCDTTAVGAVGHDLTRDVPVGVVYQNEDQAEVTVIFHAL